jgi:hypothetical protein
VTKRCLELKQAADTLGQVECGVARLREHHIVVSWWACLCGLRHHHGEEREEMPEDGAVAIVQQLGPS